MFEWKEYLCEGGGVGRMDRHDKIEKINAEIARMEVEMELECGTNTLRMECPRLDSRQDMGASFPLFSWRTDTGRSGVIAMSEHDQIEAFSGRVLDESLKRLGLLLSIEGITYAKVLSKDIAQYVDVSSVLPIDMPSIQWKVTVASSEYIIFLFAKSSDVKMRILKVNPSDRPHLSQIKEMFCWTGDPKANLAKVISDVHGQIEKLHTTDDQKLIEGKTKKK